MARFANREEYDQFKNQKIEEDKERAEIIKASEKFVRHKTLVNTQETSQNETPPQSFIERLPGIFAYPFKGSGTYLIIGGIVFFMIMDFLSVLPLIGIVLGIIISGYMCAFMMKIVVSSADGKSEVPEWPDFTNVWDDILHGKLILSYGAC
jgi:hypothetical protein